MLTAAELELYRRDGWVVPRFRLPASEVDALCAALDRMIADNPGIRPERLVNAHLEGSAEGTRALAVFPRERVAPVIVASGSPDSKPHAALAA